jgi:RimJ/RimL family protein N-acetyltransferase
MAVITLEGRKVVLGTLEREHCRTLWETYEPTGSVPSEPLNPGLSVEGAETWFEEMQAKQGREQVHLGIFTLEGQLVGDIQLTHIDWRNRSVRLGVGIARRADRGKGYGTDAVRTLLDYAFAELDLVRVTARTMVNNIAARRVLESCGFTHEGTERQAVCRSGRRWDILTYGLLVSEHEAGPRES